MFVPGDEGIAPKGSVTHLGLLSYVSGLAYNFVERSGHLDMSADSCCDMKGCIELFERIDPGCRRIDTFAGAKPDTIYVRLAGGRWTAYEPPNG